MLGNCRIAGLPDCRKETTERTGTIPHSGSDVVHFALAGVDTADDDRLLLVQQGEHTHLVGGRARDDEADAHVERAEHLVDIDVPTLLQ